MVVLHCGRLYGPHWDAFLPRPHLHMVLVKVFLRGSHPPVVASLGVHSQSLEQGPVAASSFLFPYPHLTQIGNTRGEIRLTVPIIIA